MLVLGVRQLRRSRRQRCNPLKADDEANQPWNHAHQVVPSPHWLTWKMRGMTYSVRWVTRMCVFAYRASVDFQGRTVGVSSCVYVCVLQIEQHILAGIYFALGGFSSTLSHAAREWKGEGVGGHYARRPLPRSRLHAYASQEMPVVPPSSLSRPPWLSVMGWEMAFRGAGMISTTCCALPL